MFYRWQSVHVSRNPCSLIRDLVILPVKHLQVAVSLLGMYILRGHGLAG